MDPDTQAQRAIELLRGRGVPFRPGLSELETAQVERRFGFVFSPAHRAFLRAGMPAGAGWPEWRGEPEELRFALAGPVDGLLFDVAHNDFWPDSWGARPATAADRQALALTRAATVPTLVPLYRHRFMPADPAPEPTPVLSVVQTDVVHYGRDLLDYLGCEFTGSSSRPIQPAQRVPFWSDLADERG